MDTWKNNNVLTRIKESYFLEDTDKDGASGLPVDASLVGGTIFYIDDEAGGEYQFFDVDGNVIENVQVGDKPYAYRVIKKGSEDKYYVYHDRVYNGRWAYFIASKRSESRPPGVRVNESLGTSEDIGSGKTNTEKVMNKDGGAYVTKDVEGYPTIWYQLQQVRNAKAGGCDDWFVPSLEEIDVLKKAAKSGAIAGGEIAGSTYKDSALNNRFLWSSSECPQQPARYAGQWNYIMQHWQYNGKYDGGTAVFFTRAF